VHTHRYSFETYGLLPDANRAEVKVLALPGRPIGDKLAALLHGVFTQDGFVPAVESDPSGRSNHCCIIDDKALADEIFRRIRHVLPEARCDDFGEKRAFDTLSCVNERCRIQLYDPGQLFAKHVDGYS
jgi:hypothetical protein